MVKATAGSAMLKRIEQERALKGTVSLTSLFQKQASAPDAESGVREMEGPTAAGNGSAMDATDDQAAVDSPAGTRTAPGASSPDQGSEPPGTQAGEDEEHAAGSDHEPAPKPARRRRLMVMSDDEDDDDEPPQAKSPSEAEGEENDAAVGDPSRYVERMRVVDGDVGSDSEADKANAKSGSSSDDEDEDEDEGAPASGGKALRLEDFDDEEEFLVAGGSVEAAMTRKEWGMAMLAENKEDDADVGESKEDKSKKAQEEKRKMYRDSEKMMRERRCLIKPAPVAKRSVKDLIAKVEARASKVAQETLATAPVSEQGDRATSAPQAPKSAGSTAAPSKMQMDEDDEDDDEILIRGNTVPSTPLQLSRTAARKSADAGAAETSCPPSAKNATGGDASAAAEGASAAHGKVKTPKKTNAPASKAAVHVLSPPSARKKRTNLRNQLLKTARSRSEHLIAAERAGIKVKRDAPPNFSDEMNLEEQSDPFPNLTVAFIVSTKYVGHKKGYVFHMGGRGLGYYNEAVQDEDEDEEQEQEQGGLHGASKIIKVKLVGNDAGLEDSDDEMQKPAEEGEKRRAPAEKGADDEGEKETIEKPKERGSIFRSFVSADEEGRALKRTQETDASPDPLATEAAAADSATVAPQPSKPAPVLTQAAGLKKYGQNGIAAMLRKQQEAASAAASSATLLPEKLQAGVKSTSVEWREPVLEDSDEADCEGDDEDDDGEDDDDDDDDAEEEEEEEEEEEDEDEDEEEKPAKKKSLNDVASIKKNTLRLGTVDAGYLRNEENALGYHDDVGIAKEDLEEGIDLMDTDGEDAEEEEEDSEEERRVAEGFIEDAKFAEEIGLDAEELQALFQRQREDMENEEDKRILDIIRGNVRRRKAAGQEDNWVPNRAARQRGMAFGQVPAGFSGAMIATQDDDLEDGQEGDAGVNQALVTARLERLKWLAERKQLEVQQAQEEQEQQEAEVVDPRVEADGANRATIRRNVSRSVPTLLAFSRQLSGVNPSAAPKANAESPAGGEGGDAAVEQAAADKGAGAGARRWRKVNAVLKLGALGAGSIRGSLRGPGMRPDKETGGAKDERDGSGKVTMGKNFFFEKSKKVDDEEDKEKNGIKDEAGSSRLPLPPGSSVGQAAPKRPASGFAKRKSSSGVPASLKRQKSTLLSALND